MTTLRLPPVLRPHVGGARDVEVEGATLREALDDLFDALPGDARPDRRRRRRAEPLRQRLRRQRGRAPRATASTRRWATARTVIVMPAMAGGASVSDRGLREPRSTRGVLLAAIGNTPLVELPRLVAAARRAAVREARVRRTRPARSRTAWRCRMIDAAEATGELAPGRTDPRAVERQHRHRAGDDRPACAATRCGSCCRSRPRRSACSCCACTAPRSCSRPASSARTARCALARELAAADPSLYMPFQYAQPGEPRRPLPHARRSRSCADCPPGGRASSPGSAPAGR